MAAVLDAAVEVLSQSPNANMAEVARAAGVTRQTVYAHFPARQVLVSAAIDHATREALAEMDSADLDRGSATQALLRFAEAGWQVFERYPLLLGMSGDDPEGERSRHTEVMNRLEKLVKRGQEAGEFDADVSPEWLASVAIALGHAAGEHVAAGRMTNDEATSALRHSMLNAFGAASRPNG